MADGETRNPPLERGGQTFYATFNDFGDRQSSADGELLPSAADLVAFAMQDPGQYGVGGILLTDPLIKPSGEQGPSFAKGVYIAGPEIHSSEDAKRVYAEISGDLSRVFDPDIEPFSSLEAETRE